ncbi:MAG: phosphoribosylformylglycinamidine synthase subunit PurL [Chitinophagaceae bacterium]|nr:phosphoribosylformylglycinamidine synthase subunit PurL [Oligoflexus sp.]
MQKELLQQFAALNSTTRAPLISEEGASFAVDLRKHKISDAEYSVLKKIVGRTPTLPELGVFSAMWSEHCSYKSSKVHLGKLPTNGPQVVVGPGENAGVIRLSGKLCVAFKMESHNHPSYIEPYQGAATGVGGILRDVFCMGARPIANLNSLRFGQRSHPKTHYLFENVVKGVGDYGNCVGIPTVAGTVSFDKTYDGNILVNAMTCGTIHEDRIFKGFATGVNNLVVYVGSATGRDGIHGASMASDSFSSATSGERSTVQVGDPFAEKLLLEATLEVLERDLVIGLQDMGAAGLTSSSFEMADRAGNGLYLNLDLVPARAQHMTAYELLLSESQERMLMCVEPGKWEALQECLKRWQLPFAIIGLVTEGGRMHIVKDGVLEVDVPVAPLAEEAPRYERPYTMPSRTYSKDTNFRAVLQKASFAELLEKAIYDNGDKAKIYRQYDHHIGNKTILGPEEEGAGLLWLHSDWAEKGEDYIGLAVSTNCNERYCAQDPFVGAAQAVAKSYRAIVATGATPLAVTDCLNYGNPEDPTVMGQIVAGIEGIGEACRALDTPVVSGNVSLYNTTDGKSIAPTPMIGMVGKHPDIRKAVPAILKTKAYIYWLRPKATEGSFGGSLLAKILDKDVTEAVPALNWKAEREAAFWIQNLVATDRLVAARDLGTGGLALTLQKMLLPHAFGGTFALPGVKGKDDQNEAAFAEYSASYVLAFHEPLTLSLNSFEHLECHLLGEAKANSNMQLGSGTFERRTAEAKALESLKI